ncbi:MFS transporter [Deinococcus misasensis]|uniref:MFS transporter n=1 Tax=Deinococcus misasensis TaxID=392413 RepID=UPI0005590D08|nr:MFS transporter [Deinococcus misasensis]
MGFRAVWQHQPSRNYVSGLFLSSIGDGVQFIANSWLALQLTGSAAGVGWVLFFSSIPTVFLSPFMGVYVDRLNRKNIAVTMDIVRALIILMVPVLYWTHGLQPWHIYLMSFMVAFCDKVFQPATRAMVRDVIPKEQLLHTNSAASIAGQLGTGLGATVSGLLIAAVSAPAAMVLNSVSFLLSAVFLAQLQYHRSQAPVLAKATFKKDLLDGFSYIQNHKNIITVYIINAFLVMSLYTVNVLLVPFTRHQLHLGPEAAGYIDATFALGAVLGGVFIPKMVQQKGRGMVMSAGLITMAFSLLLFSQAGTLWMAMVGYFFIGLSFSVYSLFVTVAQEQVLPEFQGRVHATFNTMFGLLSLVIYLGMGHLSDVLSERYLFVFLGVLVGVASVWSRVTLVRKMRLETV